MLFLLSIFHQQAFAPLVKLYISIYNNKTHPLLIIAGGDSQSSNKRSLYERNGVAVCSQKKALIIASSVFACLLAFSILIAFISQTGEKYKNEQSLAALFTIGLPQIVLVWDKATTRMTLTSSKTACPGNQRHPTESPTLGTACDCQILCDPYATTSPYIPISPLTS